MIRIISLWLLLKLTSVIMAQEIQNNKDYFDFLFNEIISETEDENVALEILQQLEEKLQQPINLNSAVTSDLNELFVLSDFQVFSILEFKRKYGAFLSLNELQLIPGIHDETIKLILPLIRLDNELNITGKESDFTPHLKQKLLLRTGINYPYKDGFTDSQDSLKVFSGNQLSKLLKYEMERKGSFRAGITMENDPGEKINWKRNNYGCDFSSAYVELTDMGLFKKIILGDFRLATGSGLVHGYGRISKSSAIHLRQNSNGIKKYSSGAEYGFMRGIAADFRKRNFRTIIYASCFKTDAGLEQENEEWVISSIKINGLHRNIEELQNKKNIKQINWGGTMIFESNHIDLGYNFSKIAFDKKLKYRVLPNRYSNTRSDKNFGEHSLFYSARYGNIMAGGEMAIDENRHYATIHNLTSQLHPLVSLQLSYRNYHPSYQSFDGSAMSESGDVSNEIGFYAGSIFYPSRFLKVSFYADRYRFPWYKYGSNTPYYGKDFLIKTDFILSRELDLFIMLKKEFSFQNTDSESLRLKEMEEHISQRLVIQTKYNVSESLSLKTKIELKTDHGNRSKWQGSFLAQDINFSLLQNKIKINTRYALFDIPDWTVRIYSWESDVYSAFSSPLFYHSGSRSNLVLKFNIGEKLDLWVKYAQTNYTSEVSSGTGVDLRTGKCFRECKLQINLKL
jgi:hypothetical protein